MNPLNDNHRTLLAAVAKAHHAHRELKDECSNKFRAAKADFLQKLEAQLEAEYGERLRALKHALDVAEEAEIAERDRVAREGSSSPLPVGTLVEEIEWKRYAGVYEPTGVKGRVEVFTLDSEYPDSQKYRRPEVGSTVVRVLKKDNTPSKKAVRFGYWGNGKALPHGWRIVDKVVREQYEANLKKESE